jgi:choline ABC transporter permease protein
MAGILERKLEPEVSAEEWLRKNPDALRGWFDGVTTFEGGAAPLSFDAPTAAPAPRAAGFEGWVTTHKIPLGRAFENAIDFIKDHGKGFFAAVSTVIQGSVEVVNAALAAIPGLVLILAIAAIAYGLHRSIPLVVFVILALVFIMNQGYWAATLETLSLVFVSALFSALIGVPIGIAAAHRPRLYAALRPVLDLMQTLPTFVYLIPTLVLFGLGVVPGLISTAIFAIPAPIRLTHLGISSVPKTLLEAGDAFGATPMQRLFKIELPSARQTILAGITQCIMLSLSMVVIAALVGAGGLGVPVVRALNSVQIDIGFEAGIAIVLLAIILDRISRPSHGEHG